jgi:hypothetical protein
MKNFALVIAFMLLATVSASAAEISKAPATPVTPGLEQVLEGTHPLFMGPHQLPPHCYALQGTSCPAGGVTTACTDVCNDKLSCTCNNIYAPPFYHTIVGTYWNCNDEC